MAQIGDIDIQGENISRAVKGFGLKLFKLKQILLQEKSSAQTETYFRETATELTAPTDSNRSIQGTARGALPVNLEPSWTKVQGQTIKFMGQSRIFDEDILMDAIPVQARTMLRVARAIADSVDKYIYTELTAATSTSGVVAAADTWNSLTEANRDPIGDLLIGISAMQVNNYDVLSNGWLLLTPLDYSSLMRNSKVINNPSFKTADVVSNGVVGQIVGLNIIVSNSVTSGEAMIVHGQRAATWKSVKSLQSAVINDQGISSLIRSWEYGQIQITDPQGLYTITGTQV